MKTIKISLFFCAILTQIFLSNSSALANNIYANNAEPTFQYFLMYDANGGDNAPTFQQSTSNIFYISNEIPTRENYIFAGWASSENAAQAEYQPGNMFLATESLTILYAVWQSNQPQPSQTFTLLYDANGGAQAPAAQTAQSAEIFCPFQISFDEPVRTGYIFLGWSTSSEAVSADFRAGDEFWASAPLTTLYAVWQKNNHQPLEHCYTLIYDDNGGALSPEPQIEYYFDFFHVFTISAAKPIRPDWDFLGWHTDANATLPQFQTNEVFLAMQEQNILYAIWQQQEQPPEPELIEYTLFYNANGGFNAPNEQQVTSTAANCLFTIAEATPQRPGHSFLGWALEAEATQPICQPGGSLITTEKQTTLYAVWQKLPAEPPYEYLKELLGPDAVRLKCANSAAGHLLCGFALKENSYTFQLQQTDNNNFTASLLIQPAAYLDDYNADISGHRLLATSSREQALTLFYDEERAAWLASPDYNKITFIVNCQAPAQPVYTELAQILGTLIPVRLECINVAQTEHYPIGLSLEPNGLQIGPSRPCSDNAYSCLLTIQAQPYIERYNTTYGPHQLALEAANEQTIQLYFNTSTQTWQLENAQLPCFKLICTEPAEHQPVYQYQLSFNANGGSNEPYPQMASAESESYAFFIPQEEPTQRGYLFIGWAVQPDANQPAYQAGQLIFLHKEAPKLTLYAVWQPNPEIPSDPEKPTPPPEKPQETAFCLYYNSNGGLETPAEQVYYSAAEEYQFEITAEQPKRNGYTFIGWALKSTATAAVYQPGDKLTLSRKEPTLTLYAVWQEGSPGNQPMDRPGGGGSGGRYQPPTQPQPEEPPQPPTPQKVPHPSYINGYADGTIRPNAYLSRAEAAVMLYRLLNPDAPTTTNETNWYDDAVNFLKQAELLQGYQDGSLQAQAYLTRAEMATLAVRVHNLQTTDFSNHSSNSIANAFPDITEHWATEAINQAAAFGWLHGYPDGTFRPNQAVSRAEAVTLLNLLFNRASCTEHLTEQPNLPSWPDNPPDAWYYTNMLEAGHSHTYTINADTALILSES